MPSYNFWDALAGTADYAAETLPEYYSNKINLENQRTTIQSQIANQLRNEAALAESVRHNRWEENRPDPLSETGKILKLITESQGKEAADKYTKSIVDRAVKEAMPTSEKQYEPSELEQRFLFLKKMGFPQDSIIKMLLPEGKNTQEITPNLRLRANKSAMDIIGKRTAANADATLQGQPAPFQLTPMPILSDSLLGNLSQSKPMDSSELSSEDRAHIEGLRPYVAGGINWVAFQKKYPNANISKIKLALGLR
jgi:hypothetical protein